MIEHFSATAPPKMIVRFALGACLAAVFCLAAESLADDRVVLQPGGRFSSKVIVRGQIEDYTGEMLTLRTNVGAGIKTYPASDVLQVETTQLEPHQRGLRLFAAHDVDRAIPELHTAVAREERAWVRREILAILIQCHLRTGDYANAGSKFLILHKSDPTTRYFNLIPLVWAPQELNSNLRDEAHHWLKAASDVARLIGASVLLDDPKLHDPAVLTLKEVSSSTDRRAALLAQAQMWRERLNNPAKGPGGGQEVGRLELQRWQVRIEGMPEELRGGPYYLLGRGYLANRDYELGAVSLLWVPLVYDHDHRLAARACLRAADALAAIGQKSAAATLYREVVEHYPTTPFAQEARALLQPE